MKLLTLTLSRLKFDRNKYLKMAPIHISHTLRGCQLRRLSASIQRQTTKDLAQSIDLSFQRFSWWNVVFFCEVSPRPPSVAQQAQPDNSWKRLEAIKNWHEMTWSYNGKKDVKDIAMESKCNVRISNLNLWIQLYSFDLLWFNHCEHVTAVDCK